jgi:DNA processing protein
MESEPSLFSQHAAARFDYDAIGDTVPRVRRETAIVALGEIQGVGHTTAVKLFDNPHFDSLFTANRDEVLWIASAAGVDKPHAFADTFVSSRSEALGHANATLRRFEDQNITLVLAPSNAYPASLREIPDHPRWLFVRGNVELLSSPRLITVVGTREPSTYGKIMARRVAQLLVRNGFVLVAGLAEGIDAIVHEEVIRQKGQTIAILGTGMYNTFPPTTAQYRKSIVELGGAIVTEYFNKEQSSRQRFVQRNRIQAALSQMTIPIEAGVPSGTLHTVRFAKQYGKTVLGVKAIGVGDTPLHQLLREEGFQVVEVPEADDPFMAAIGSHYSYSDFKRDGEIDRRNSVVTRAITWVRRLIRNEGLGPLERKRIIDGILSSDDE